jgi:hypothetical protein
VGGDLESALCHWGCNEGNCKLIDLLNYAHTKYKVCNKHSHGVIAQMMGCEFFNLSTHVQIPQ